MPIFLRVVAVHFGHEVTDEGLLIERREVGAEKIVPSSIETVMVDLKKTIVCHLFQKIINCLLNIL